MELKTIEIKKRFGHEIKTLWDQYNHIDITKRGYALQDNIHQNAVLFVGINPSYNEKAGQPLEFYYTPEQDGKNHPYFRRFADISKEIGLSWGHFDLLFFRETRQKFINELFHKDKGANFIFDQLSISKKALIALKPKIIVVSNSMAKHLLGFDKDPNKNTGVWMDFDFIFDEDLGTYRITSPEELCNVPIFFTSMLTGQRALDNGSYQRLVWHIKFVLSKLTNAIP